MFRIGSILLLQEDTNNDTRIVRSELRDASNPLELPITFVSGDYFLQTNGSNPYARGILGTKYIDPKELPGYKYDSDEDT